MGPPLASISAPSAEPALTELTSANFDSVILHSGKPAFVDFFAYVCGRKFSSCILPEPLTNTKNKAAKNLLRPIKNSPIPSTILPS